jgi:hypothetical protein
MLANYMDATTILGSNIYLLHELIDRSNVTIVDSNGKIDWNRLKNFPESDDGLDIFNLAQSAYDLAQLGYDMYQQLQSLLGNTPALPDNIKDPLGDALGDSNETSSNAINVAWERVFRRPIAASNFSIGVRNDLYLSDLSKVYRIPAGGFSTNNGSLYNTTSSCNLQIDMTTETLYPQAISMGSNQVSTSNAQFGPVSIGSSGISTVSNVSLNISSARITSNITNTNSISTKFMSACNITNQIYSSNLANAAVPLTLSSSCNLILNSSNHLQLTSCNLNVSQSNLTWIQQTSNPNPFQDPFATTGISLNTSNIVLKNLQSNQTTLFIQDPASFKFLFSKSNGSNVTNSTILFDSNQGVSGISNILLNGDLLNPSLYTSCNSLVVTSNIFSGGYILANGDLACSNVVRTGWMQLGNSLPINKTTYVEGLYSRSAKLLISQDGDAHFLT